MQWLGFNGSPSARVGKRSLRVGLESLESRSMLAITDFTATVLGDSFDEGTDSIALEIIVGSDTDTTVELSWNLDVDDDFGDGDEPNTVLNLVANVPQTFLVPMSWNTLTSFEEVGVGFIGDTLDANVRVHPFTARLVEETLEGTLEILQTTEMTLVNRVPVIDDDNDSAVIEGGGGGCGGGAGGEATLVGSFTEFGLNDEVFVEVDWGDGNIEQMPSLGEFSNQTNTFEYTHTYTTSGPFTITYKVWDDEGGEANASIGTVVTTGGGGGGGGPQTVCLEDGVLTVNGSTGSDNVVITASAGNIVVSSNFPDPSESFAAGLVNQIVVLLGDGDDVVLNNTTKAMVAVGGDGTDILMDSGGRSILIGGAGVDVLSGGSGQDILIDSSTDHDADTEALLAILSEWNMNTLLSTRITNIMGGVGTGDWALNSSTIDDDGDFDLLIGGGGIDWILLHSGDLSLGLFDVVDVL